MSKPTMVRGRLAHYHPTQIAVELEHLRLILAALAAENLGIAVVERREDRALGLALLELRFPAERLSELRAELRDADPTRNVDDMPDLDVVLDALRRRIRAQHGFVPPMGKNRTVDTGFPHVGGGGDGIPDIPTTIPEALLAPRSTARGRGVRVAVLDTRLYTHRWLAGAYLADPASLIHPAEATGRALSEINPLAGHATFVAGLILQQAGAATIEVADVLDDDATGLTWDAATKLVRFAGSGVDVVNLSWGCYTDDGNAPLVLDRAVSRLVGRVHVVAAAGNHGQNTASCPRHADCPDVAAPAFPASLPGVLAVGAKNAEGYLAPFSPDAPWVNQLALGVGTVSTYLDAAAGTLPHPFAGVAAWDGTSFAAATVSGMLASFIDPDGTNLLDVPDMLRQLGATPVGAGGSRG